MLFQDFDEITRSGLLSKATLTYREKYRLNTHAPATFGSRRLVGFARGQYVGTLSDSSGREQVRGMFRAEVIKCISAPMPTLLPRPMAYEWVQNEYLPTNISCDVENDRYGQFFRATKGWDYSLLLVPTGVVVETAPSPPTDSGRSEDRAQYQALKRLRRQRALTPDEKAEFDRVQAAVDLEDADDPNMRLVLERLDEDLRRLKLIEQIGSLIDQLGSATRNAAVYTENESSSLC